VLSQLGDWVLAVALPLHVYDATGSVVATGTLFAAQLVPPMLLSSAAGVLVDRWDRRATMIAADLVRGVVLLAILAVRSPADLWIVYAVSFLHSTAGLFFPPARGALMPALVDEADLAAANALTAQGGAIARLVAPPIGAALMAGFGLGAGVLVDSASFAVSAALLALVPVEARPAPTGKAAPGWRGAWAQWREGMALIASDRSLLVLFAAAGLVNLGDGAVGPLFVPFVEQVLGGGASEIGWWYTTNAAGGIVGGLAIARWARRWESGRLLGFGLAGVGACVLLRNLLPGVLASAGAPRAAAIALNPAVGIGAAAATASLPTLVQTGVPDSHRGRVFGTLGTTNDALMLVGILLATGLGDRLGPLVFFHAVGIAYLAAGALVLLVGSSVARQRTKT
jgi:MFS family permease